MSYLKVIESMGLVFLLVAIATGCSVHERQVSPEQQFRAIELMDQGVMQLRSGELDAARASFQLSFDIAPSAAAIDGQGAVCFQQGDFVCAEQRFFESLESDPEYSQALYNLATLYHLLGEHSLADKYYERALESMPDDARLRNNFAVLLAEDKGFRSMAKDYFEEARQLVPHPIIEDNASKLEKLKW